VCNFALLAILALMWFEQMHPLWQSALANQRVLVDSLEDRLASLPNLSPQASKVMTVFETSPASVRVVILGQDPYPTPGVAVGRAFAVSGPPIPASLRNILKELDSDIGADFGDLGPGLDLAGWQAQGVFLLNRHLTTLHNNAGAHFKEGWQTFTDAALQYLVSLNPNLILVLWGKEAASAKSLLEGQAASPRFVESVHPSPLSAHRGFFGSAPFSKVNVLLGEFGQEQINWKA